MSTILKALRRIEDDKAPPPGARPLREEVAAVPGEPLARRRWGDGRMLGGVGALGLGLLALALAGGALWLSRGQSATEAPAPARAAAPERAAPEPRVEAAASPPAGERRAAAPPRRDPAPAPAPAPARREPPVAEPASPTAPTAPPAPRPAPEPARPSATTDPEPAVRNVMPELTVAGTVWHPDPGRRTARVELAGRGEPLTLREGDAVGSLVVKGIEPSGVVFRMGEVEVRRRVGE